MGCKKELFNVEDSEIIERAIDELSNSNIIPSKTLSDIVLPLEASNKAKITWSSSMTSVISNDGKVTRPEKEESVVLTATITFGKATDTKSFTTTVLPANVIPDYKYDFESASGKEVADSGSTGKAATLIGDAYIEKLHLQEMSLQ